MRTPNANLFPSAFSILWKILHSPWAKQISGSRSATFSNSRKMWVFEKPFSFHIAYSWTFFHSMTLQRTPTFVYWIVILIMLRSCNNSDGSTTNKVPIMLHKNKPSSFLRNPLALIKLTHRAGTCLVAATCLSISFRKRMKHINKLSTVMDVIQPFGVQSVCSTIKSINIEMLSMHTLELYASIPTFQRCGMTWVLW